MADLLQRANYREPNAVEQNRGADRRSTGKQRAADFVANNYDRAFLRIVHLVDPTAVVDRQVTDLVEVGWHTYDLATSLEKIAYGSNVAALDSGGSCADARALPHNVLVIAVRQIVLAQRGEAALHDGGTTGPDKHHVFAQGVELFAVPRPESFSQSYQQKQGTHAPGNAEHSEERAQFMRPEGAESLTYDVED